MYAVSPVPSARIWRVLKRIVTISILSATGVVVVAFWADYGVFRYRVSAHRQPFGQVTVIHYYAVQKKGNKLQFIFDPPEEQTCANALFPQAGDVPCWYLRRHNEQRTDI